ncbi:MAG TPA: hypothetical protein VGF99_15490 [Myxococcota bacterium]
MLHLRHATLVIIAVASLAGCLGSTDVDSCDLDKTFSDSEQNVNCIETAAGSREYVCTCPDGDTFPSSDTCDKSAEDQGDLIDSACPEAAVPGDGDAPAGA